MIIVNYKTFLKSRNVNPFTWQERALIQIQTHERVVVEAPTGSGKTLLAEYMLMDVLELENDEQHSFSVFITPMRSLLEEHKSNLSYWLSQYDVNVTSSLKEISDKNKSILLSTPEQFHRQISTESKKFNKIDLLILDEVHLVGDVYRGSLYELISSYLLTISKKVIAMSATIGDKKLISKWLNANLIISEEERKVKLEKEIIEVSSNVKKLEKISVVINEFPGQIIIFRSQIGFTEKTSEFIQKRNSLPADVTQQLKDMITESDKANWVTKLDKKWIESFISGFPFHHSRIRKRQRELVEKAFQKRLAKVIISTPTLMMGVNLPADMVMIAEPMIGINKLTSIQLHQMIGRAGRPGKASLGMGYAKLLSTTEKITDTYGYLLTRPRKLSSVLDEEKSLIPLLRLIDGSFLSNEDQINKLCTKTIKKLPRTKKKSLNTADKVAELLNEKKRLKHPIKSAEEKLKRYKSLIINSSSKFELTPLGKVCSKYELSPDIAYGLIHSDIWKFDIGTISFFDTLLQSISITLRPTSKQNDTIETAKSVLDKFNLYYTPIKWSMREVGVILFWLLSQGTDHSTIVDLFDLYPVSEEEAVTKVNTWFDAILDHSELFNVPSDLKKRISLLIYQLKYGLSENQAEFSMIDGVGNVIAKTLEKHFITLYKLSRSSIEDIASVLINDKKIGLNKAEKIKKQATILSEKSGKIIN